MDQQSSARWLETLRAEQRAKSQWEFKYLTEEQRMAEEAEQAAALSELGATKSSRRTLSERDAMELRLSALDSEENAPPPKERVAPAYETLRARVAADVAAHRQRSHRFTGDLSTESMLKDIGPGLWTSINPQYAPLKLSSSQHRTHSYDKSKGWGSKVDKSFHLKQDAFMARKRRHSHTSRTHTPHAMSPRRAPCTH